MSDEKKNLSELNDYDEEELDLTESEEESEKEESEYEEEAEQEEESEYEEEAEQEEESEYEEEAEQEEESEYEEEAEQEEEVEEESKSSRKLIYGLGAITILAGGYFGYQQLSTPSYNNVTPAQSSPSHSSSIDEPIESLEDSVSDDTQSLSGNGDDVVSPSNIEAQEPIAQEPIEMEEPEQPEADMVIISEDEYKDLIERIENLEKLIAEKEEAIVDFEDRFNVLDDLIQTVEATKQRVDKVEKDINSMKESFAIIDEMKKEQQNLLKKVETQSEENKNSEESESSEESKSNKASSKKEEKRDISVASNKDVKEKEEKEVTVKKTNTSNTPKFIPESDRQVIAGWKGVAIMNNGNKVAIDLGDGRFITLVENEPVKVYGRVQRISDDGTVYFRTHKINFMN
jgi:hypothetical protein